MFVSCLCRVRQRDFTQLHALCVSMCIYVYAYMYAICARYACGSAGTSLFHSQGSAALSVFHALHACGSAGTFTLPLPRQRGGTWACLYVGGDGLPDCSALSLLVCWGSRSSWWSVSCSPVALRVWFVLSCCQRSVMLSAMHAHDLARLRTTC